MRYSHLFAKMAIELVSYFLY